MRLQCISIKTPINGSRLTYSQLAKFFLTSGELVMLIAPPT